ncbi:MAG: hypothetical protein ACE5FO_10970 [Parvularculaceae bacterium]
MEDLQYIISLGFSGSDVPRAIALAFFAAMVTSRQSDVWVMAGWLLFIDRVIWPIAAMGLAGADIHSIYAAIGAMVQNFPADLGIYVVRYLGICLMMSLFISGRRRIHRASPPKTKQAPAYPY